MVAGCRFIGVVIVGVIFGGSDWWAIFSLLLLPLLSGRRDEWMIMIVSTFGGTG